MKNMKCSECGHIVENVDDDTTSVKCWKCVNKSLSVKEDVQNIGTKSKIVNIKKSKKEVKMVKKEKNVDENIQKLQDYMKKELSLDIKSQKQLLSRTYHTVLNLTKN